MRSNDKIHRALMQRLNYLKDSDGKKRPKEELAKETEISLPSIYRLIEDVKDGEWPVIRHNTWMKIVDKLFEYFPIEDTYSYYPDQKEVRFGQDGSYGFFFDASTLECEREHQIYGEEISQLLERYYQAKSLVDEHRQNNGTKVTGFQTRIPNDRYDDGDITNLVEFTNVRYRLYDIDKLINKERVARINMQSSGHTQSNSLNENIGAQDHLLAAFEKTFAELTTQQQCDVIKFAADLRDKNRKPYSK